MRMSRTQAIIRLALAGLLLLFIYYNLFTGGQGPR
jgi:hypothetical protein